MRIFIILNIILSLLVSCSTAPVTTSARLSPGELAPSFALPNMLTSEEVTIGKVFNDSNATVLIFWSMACPVCREALLEMDDLFKAYRGRVVSFFAINFDIENLHGVRAFAKGENLEMPILWDRGGNVTKSYKAYDYTFSLFVVDRQGKLVIVQYDHTPDLRLRVQEVLDRAVQVQ